MDSTFFYRNPNRTESPAGKLAGMTVAIQSGIGVAGWPMDPGSDALAGFQAAENAAVVERLQQNGAFLVGSTHTSEFGLGLDAQSAAGRAIDQKAARAEMMLDLAGEARLAACRAGIWGFKPSWGLIPRVGIAGLLPSMEACGILAGAPEDIRLILAAVAGPDDRDFSQPVLSYTEGSPAGIRPDRMTLGVVEEAKAELAGDEQKAFDEELAQLKKAGFKVKMLSWPDYGLCGLVHRIVGSVEASSSAGRYDSVRYGKRAPGAKNWNDMYLQSRGAFFKTLLKSYLIQGAYFQFERYDAYENACRIRARLCKEFSRLFEQVEALVFPVQKPDTPESLENLYDQFKWTAHANVTGCPALTAAPFAAGGPALQFVGALKDDARILALGTFLSRPGTGGKS